MGASLREVAERAGVSGATVSRILNNVQFRVSSETRHRVMRIAAEMDYQPNRAAQALVTGRTQTLALWASNLRSPFYSRVIFYTRQEIMRHQYDLMISGARFREDGALDTSKLLSWPVDGVLALDLPRGEIPSMENSLLSGKPFATLGAYVTESADYVKVDFESRVEEAVLHLDSVGCRRIAYLVPDWFEWFHQVRDGRFYGYNTAIAGLGRKPEYIVTPDEARQNVAVHLNRYIDAHGCPDGIFCFNDDMAMGAFRALRDRGIRIPEQTALVGCDGIEETAYSDPQLTTVAQPLEEMCSRAWTFLERRIQQPTLPLQQITLQPRLEIRGSSLR